MTDRQRFILTIRPEPAGIGRLGRDPVYRLKLLLKRMLRDHGWRCVEIRPDISRNEHSNGITP